MEEYITCIEKIENRRESYCIYINDTYYCKLNKSDIKKTGLKENMLLTEDIKEALRELLIEKALNKALYLIKNREYTCFEIEKKLKDADYPEDIAGKVIDILKEKRFLDDTRYIESYLYYYFHSKSKAVIMNNLLKKGLNKDDIEKSYEEMREDDPEAEKNLCKNLVVSHFHNIEEYHELSDEDKYKYKIKVKRFLASKGFSFYVIDEILSDFF